MTRFEVEIPGHMYCLWPSGENLIMLDCCFTAGSKDREFIVSSEVDAKDKEKATRVGREKCQDATNLLALCMKETLDLNELSMSVREKGGTSTVHMHSPSLDTILVSNAPLTKEQLEAADMANSKILAEQDDERKEYLTRAIHWQALGRRETENKIDRFFKFWIALEVLVEGRGDDLVRKVRVPLEALYPHCSPIRIADVVGRIYSVRGDIVHLGLREPQQLDEKLKQLEDILSDLFRQRLGLVFKALARKHLE